MRSVGYTITTTTWPTPNFHYFFDGKIFVAVHTKGQYFYKTHLATLWSCSKIPDESFEP